MKNGEIISKMTLEEKASLTSGKDFWQTMNIDRLGIPSIFLSDGPSGLRKQAAAADRIGLNASIPATCFPSSSTIANGWNYDVAYAVGKALGEEAVRNDVSMVLGPGTNIKRNPLCGRNFEYYSEDPYLAGKMASGFVNGIQENGISACVKHYAGNNQETRRMSIDTIIDERALREIYLTAFEMVVKEAKTKSVMSSYNQINGYFVNENMHLMRDILRGDWKYEGVVVTDWGGSNSRTAGLIAGNELEMPATAGESDAEIVEAVKSGKLSEAVLDECVDRMLTLIQETVVTEAKKRGYTVEEHHAIAAKAAEETIVLLKNKDDILPLAKEKSVAVIGDFATNPRYQGAGSSNVNPTKIDSPLDIVKKDGFNLVGFEAGFNRYGKPAQELHDKALELAGKAEVILLFIGLDEVSEAEGVDRKDLKIPQTQIELISDLAKLGKPIVGVLQAGAVVEMPWIDELDALVFASLGGQAGAQAILDVVSGKICPSGKLSETYPYVYEDTPTYKFFPGKEVSVEYRESIYVGYRYYDKANVKVRFPFGFGLSYTSFEYSDLKVNDKGVEFKIKNVGKCDGSEVAQLYVGLPNSKIFRAEKELKGFAKVFLKKGEEKSVKISFDDKTFRYFNVNTDKFEIEEGNYSIMIGASCADIKLNGSLSVKGTTTNLPYDSAKLPSYYSGKVNDVELAEFETLMGGKIVKSTFDLDEKGRMTMQPNDTLGQLKYAKGGLARFAAKILDMVYSGMDKGAKNLFEMSVYNQTYRGLAKLAGGVISIPMVSVILLLINGQSFKAGGMGKTHTTFNIFMALFFLGAVAMEYCIYGLSIINWPFRIAAILLWIAFFFTLPVIRKLTKLVGMVLGTLGKKK